MRYLAIGMLVFAVPLARADEAETIERMRNDPGTIRAVVSAVICASQEDRKEDLAELQQRKKYSALGGVEDAEEIYNLQQAIRVSDMRIERFRKALRQRRVIQIPCVRLDSLVPCIRAEGQHCDERERLLYALVQPEL